MTEALPTFSFVCDRRPKTAEIYTHIFGGKKWAMIFTNAEKGFAYVVPYAGELIAEETRAAAWAQAVNESKGQFVKCVIVHSPACN
jgi:hypothetical protein